MDTNAYVHQSFKFKKYLAAISNHCWMSICIIIYLFGFLLILRQYQTKSFGFNISLPGFSKQPDTSGTLTKMIVVSHFEENLDWLDLYIGEKIPHIVYTHVNDSLTLHYLPINKGREAAAYLRYIVDYYSNLPSLIAFVHAHRRAWHQKDPSDIVVALRALRWNKYTYMPLNSFITDAVFKPNTGKEQVTVNYELWRDVLQDELGPPPEKGINTHCCATFVVKREAILAHPKHFYSRLLDYVVSNKGSDVAKGRTLEYTWHVIFGQPANSIYKTCDIFVCDSEGNISVQLAENNL